MAVDGVGLGRGLGWRAVGRGDTLPPPSSAVSFFFATWPFLAIRNVRVLGFTDDGDETGLPPLNPLVLRTENRQNFGANFFFQKKIWRQFFLAILNTPHAKTVPGPEAGED